MKPILVALALGTLSVQAFDVPRHVFTFDRLTEAQNEAYEDEKPMLFLYCDPKKEPT